MYIVHVCEYMIHMYITTFIFSQDPDKVCSEIKLCDISKFLAKTQPKAVGSPIGGLECFGCKEAVKILFTEVSI